VILSNSDALLAAALFGAAGAGGLYCLWPHMRWGIYVITGLMILASDMRRWRCCSGKSVGRHSAVDGICGSAGFRVAQSPEWVNSGPLTTSAA
jgi:hypothetical protein